MSGPPTVLYLAGLNFPKNEFRKTLATFFFSMIIVSITLFITNQIITFKRASFGLVSLPFVFLAGFLGDKIAIKVPQKLFKILTLEIVLLSGLYNTISGLR